MSTKAGTQAILYLGDNSGNAAPLTETFNLSIEVTTDTAEDTAHGDTWRTRIPTLSDFTLQIEKHISFAAAGNAIQKAVINRTLQKFYLYPDRADSTIYWYGTGYVGGGGMAMGLEDVIDGSFSWIPVSQPTYIHA